VPLAKIHVLEGRYTEARLSKVSDVIHVLPPRQFLHTRSFFGLHHSDVLILLEIIAAADISPDDPVITLYETRGESISFGLGLAQRAHIPESDARVAS